MLPILLEAYQSTVCKSLPHTQEKRVTYLSRELHREGWGRRGNNAQPVIPLKTHAHTSTWLPTKAGACGS